jgi:hypothetical protein
MKKPQRWLYSQACLFPLVLGVALSGFVRADPPSSPKLTASTMKKPEIPSTVLQDIRRVHPGMTRADLDWLFTPDGGASMGISASYIYRYAGVDLAVIDVTGKPVLDKVTHRPVVYAQAIKIDVSFKPAAGRGWATATEDGTSRQLVDPDGSPDDMVVSVSDPYVGFAVSD